MKALKIKNCNKIWHPQEKNKLADKTYMILKKVKKIFFYSFIPLVLLVFIDFITKHYAQDLLEMKYFGVLRFKLVYNYGFIGGQFSSLSLKTRELIVFSFAFYIFLIFTSVLVFAPIRSRKIFLGSAFILAGIGGNFLDRIFNFGVIDFISLNLKNTNMPFFNVADISQWIGYLVLLAGLRDDYKFYWPTKEWRQQFIIKKTFQFRVSFILSFSVFLLSCFSFLFSLLFLKSENSFNNMNLFALCTLLISTLNSIFTFICSLVLTHRVAGPIYAIQRQISLITNNQFPKFQLRSNDEFKEIETDINKLTLFVEDKVNSQNSIKKVS